ncbi:MAG: exo-alpha-sialidase [Adhaeribacter sp.]
MKINPTKITWPLLAAFLLLSACRGGQNQEPALPQQISAGKHKSAGPYLTQNHQGRAVLCWVEAQDATGNYLLTYAIADEEGQTFGTPQAIPTTKGIYPHDENLSKLVFRKNGDIMALFAVSNPNPENSYAGLVFYTQSFDGGQSWTAPRQLAQNTRHSIDERYFDMTLLPDGEIAAVWLDSRKDTGQEGSSLYFARTRGREGFVGEKVIARQLCQCCRTDLYADQQGKLHVAYRAIIEGRIRDMVYLVSSDKGESFSPPERISADNWVIAGCPHTGPAMTSNQQGMHFAWFTMGGGSGVYYNQKPAGKAFSARQTVSQAKAARHPQMATLPGGKIAITWDEQAPAGNPHHRIGLQLREATGQLIRNLYLTADSVTATHPVILPVKAQKVVVAYTQKSGQQSQVWYQVVGY